MRHGYCRCIRDTNGKILSGLCPLSALESERDLLKGELKEALNLTSELKNEISVWREHQCFEVNKQRDTLAKENIQLKIENERLFTDFLKSKVVEKIIEIEKSFDTFKKIARELAEALKAQIQMRDMKKPTKLEEELSWRENDELAAKMGEEALAAYDKAVKGIS